MSAAARALAAYAAYFATLTRAGLAELDRFVAPAVRFKDPFNDVTGVEPMRRVLATAWDHGTPRFEVLDRALGERAGYLRWRYRAGGASSLTIEGMSEVRFDAAGRVCEHIDHWDAAGQLYERVPVLGWVLRRARRRLAPRDRAGLAGAPAPD